MKFVFSEKYYMELEGHVFPAQKFRLIVEKLLSESVIERGDLIEPEPPKRDELLLVHTEDYLDDFINKKWTLRTIYSELPLNDTIVEGFILMAGGTYLAAKFALEDGIGFHVGGGFHHAYPDHAEGFCYINDIAFAIRKLQRKKIVKKAAVIDCDLHQGNGTAKIFEGDPSVFTFSIHQEYLYPIPKERSDWDIGLLDGTGDGEYLKLLSEAVPKIYDDHKPELVIYQAGADPFKDDQLGNLMLTKEGLSERDRIVIGEAVKRGIPVAITLGGGYARKVDYTVEIHVNTAKVALSLLNRK
jgi:acetoin utilization deacetylase AcuC-like enzyme